MQLFLYRTTITKNRVLTLHGVPFNAGDQVAVIVLSHSHKRVSAKRYPLHGKRIRYTAPFELVAANEWDAAR